MSKRLRADHDIYEFRGGHVRVSRTTRDCDMAEHKDGWQGAIQPGCTYVWLSHGLNVCNLHFSMEDVTNGPVHPSSPSDRSPDEPSGDADD